MQAEILLTLKLQQKLFADPRRISLLKHIALSGSISQGAKDAGISYKSAWDAINEMNQLSEHVDVLLADGKTRLKVAVTAQSGARLGLDEGKEVLILLKAPWVGITQDEAVAQNADNQLPGIISHIERGAEQCEVLMALPDGQTLCATVPVNEATSLQQGQNVTAYFNADSVIIATLC